MQPLQWVTTPDDDAGAWPAAIARGSLVFEWRSGVDASRAPHPVRVVSVGAPCSLGEGGLVRRGVRRLGVPDGVRAAVRWLEADDALSPEAAATHVAGLAAGIGAAVDALGAGRHALLCLADERYPEADLLAALLGAAVPGLPLIGGLFPDGVAIDGEARPGGVALVLLGSDAPITTFQAHPFATTEVRAVVTGCDPSGRRVDELDGWPAAERFAALAGVPITDLDGGRMPVMRRLDAQLAWVLGGRALLRPVVGRDGSALRLGGAVRRGAVLRLTRRSPDVGGALVAGVERALSERSTPPAAVWAFACGGFLEAPTGERFGAGLAALGVVACAVHSSFHGPTLSCGSVSGVALGVARGG